MPAFKYITWIVFGLSIVCYLYVMLLYVTLFRSGIITTYKRISFKVINEAMRDKRSDVDIIRLQYLKRVYRVYLFLFSSTLILAAALIGVEANR